MAVTATVAATQSAIVSTTKLSVLLHSSRSYPFYYKLYFPQHSDRLKICHYSRRSNSGTQEFIDEYDDAFFSDDVESGIDLLLIFLQSMFKNISKRAKKATRDVLPFAISKELVSFAIDGVLLLASLSIVKALLEVVCNLGGTVFSVILLLRVIWTIVSFFHVSGSNFNQSRSSF